MIILPYWQFAAILFAVILIAVLVTFLCAVRNMHEMIISSHKRASKAEFDLWKMQQGVKNSIHVKPTFKGQTKND
jgi:hypothetical protein